MNLDRFSRPIDGETFFKGDEFHEMYGMEEDNALICCGCGIEIDETEAVIESKLYEDHYMHDLEECKVKYEMSLKTEKDLPGTGRSLDAV
ncbi:hypothetical protein ABIC37_005422 [Priestia megaterium]|uniref:hypothetical protein n=1 Tax=Priestia megaterium TaxID=1404 RepID=UPI003393FEAF